MSEGLFENVYNPDVLSCLANLSSDEVFTPPSIANAMLDMLPQELFSNPDTKILDPACKSGVFLREAAKRLDKGLESQIPDREQRMDHIFKKQLFGIAITELTSLISRRSVYCSAYPNSKYSVARFDDEHADGNIRFKRIDHLWKDGKCSWCGAAQTQYDRSEDNETHAYEFIHCNPEELYGMKFDVIISNPPYQLSDGSGGQGSSATPIYQKFVLQAKKLNPRFLSMIIPSRWFVGGKGLDEFRDVMLNDKHITHLVDFQNSSDCFSGVSIKGGVCYFLRERDKEQKCHIVSIRANQSEESDRYLLEDNCDVFIRWEKAVDIFRKVSACKEKTFDSIVSTRKPFGLSSTFSKFSKSEFDGSIKIYANKSIGYVDSKEITQNISAISKYKVYISFAYGAGEDFPHQIVNKPFFGDRNTCCTETYLVIGPFDSSNATNNVLSYIKTKFFRFMVLLRKSTQNATAKVYASVPMQDFSKPWTDEELYAKYNLTQEEIDFIESMIKPMELGGDDNG